MMEPSKVVIPEEKIGKRVRELGRQIQDDYKDKKLLVIGVQNGSFIFLADLVRAIALPMEIDFLRVASYDDSDSSSGSIRLVKEPELDTRDKDILLVEDIVDTGTTVAWLRQYFAEHAARSVRLCVLIDKRERRQKPVQVDYSGFTVDSGFLVGYGLDYAQRYRNLPAIYTLD